MLVDIVMPKMGESLQEGTIIRWTKKVGDRVERDETILEISTDKVDTEVPSPVAGVIKALLFGENETVAVGTKIAEIETDADTTIHPEPIPTKEEVITPQVEAKPTGTTISGNFVDVVMPKMGESLQEGTIIRWTKKVGDRVERDETILEISTDKVDTEVPSPVEGILAEILAAENQTVEVGKVIARINTGGDISRVESTAQTTQVSTEKPDLTAIPVEIQNQKSSDTFAEQTQTMVVGVTYEIPARDGERFYSPLVREIAQQNKVSLEELRTIKGTGSDGRVTKEDLMNYINSRKSQPTLEKISQQVTETPRTTTPQIAITSTEPKTTTTIPAYEGEINPIFRAAGEFEVVPMDRVRQLIAEHMTRSKATSAHVTSVAEADVTEIVKFREKYKDEFFRKEGFKLTYTPFFALAAVEGIKQFPGVNVGVDGNKIIKFKHINLSIATALDDGNLIVPVIKKAEELNLTGLARQIYDLSTRARNKKLNPDDIQGGTFSVTNVGTFGTLFGTPVINQPQTAIMGIGAIQKRPVVKEIMGNDMILVRHMAYVSLTYDHRVIDGMLAGQCLSAIVKSLENMNENTIKI